MKDNLQKLIDSNPLVVGCNYHTTWQLHPAMRFVLHALSGDWAQLKTRMTRKFLWTKKEDLIFIGTKYNAEKAIELNKGLK